MASSAFSFHCMICFEEFDPQTNYPVVLPCGHTYVCIECANRLDKCMECRTPLHIKIELPPPPPPTGTPSPSTPAHHHHHGSAAQAAAAAAAAAGGMHSPDLHHHQKENTSQNTRAATTTSSGYADRVRNSPGFRRRYGHRDEYQQKRGPYGSPSPGNANHTATSSSSHSTHHHQPPQPIPKQRLPLPKNAVLLSLIQASEPARRRAEVEAPPTPQKVETDSTTRETSGLLLGTGGGVGTPSPGDRGGFSSTSSSTTNNNATSGVGSTGGSLPKFSRPSPLFLDGSSSGEHDTSGNPALQGSLPDDEEHKIRVGTYLEGGPCGTYAVASKNGLLVYPTLFEHTLPSALGSLRREEDVDIVKRDVEMVVKNYYRESAGTRNFPGTSTSTTADDTGEKDGEKNKGKTPKRKNKKKTVFGKTKKSVSLKTGSADNDGLGGGSGEGEMASNNTHESPTTPPSNTHMNQEEEQNLISSSVSHTTWVECCHDENIETHCTPSTSTITEQQPTVGMSSNDASLSLSPTGASIPILGEYDTSEDEDTDTNDNNRRGGGVGGRGVGFGGGVAKIGVAARSDPGGSMGGVDTARLQPLAACASLDNEDVGLSVSLTVSDSDDLINSDDDDDDDDEENEGGDVIGASIRTMPARRAQSIAGAPHTTTSTTSPERASSPLSSSMHANSSSSKDGKPISKKLVRHFSQGTYLNKKKQDAANNTTSNSNNAVNSADEFERPLIRLKYGDRVQVVSMDSRGWVKLARGYGYIRLENDKQLVKVGGTSDKACQIEAMLHELSIERNRLKHEQTKLERLSAGLMIDLQSSLLTSDDHVVVPAPEGSLHKKPERTASNVSLDDIDVSTRSRTVLTPPRSNNIHAERAGNNPNGPPHREIRTAKSHSPGRTSTLPGINAATNAPATVGGTAQHPKPPPSPPYGQVRSGEQSHNNWSSVNTPTRVNFRTGLSGHRALTSSHSHPHDFIGSGRLRSMSNHAGISSTKKPGNRGRSIY